MVTETPHFATFCYTTCKKCEKECQQYKKQNIVGIKEGTPFFLNNDSSTYHVRSMVSAIIL